MFRYGCALVMAFSVVGMSLAHHKILYLISTPRSLSTIFLRAMHARDDMSIFNEPLVPVWYGDAHAVKQWYGAVYGVDMEEWCRSGVPRTSKEVVDRLLAESELHPVFVKEQSFMVQNLLKEDDRIFNDPGITFAMLLRNPHHSIISFYKKWGQLVDNFSEIVGYRGCYELYHEIKKKTDKAPVIVIAEEMYTNTADAMQLFCKNVGIPFLREALQWQSLGTAFDGVAEWHEVKVYERTHYWHGDAILSTGFQKPRQYEVDAEGNPTFSEIANLDDRERCKEVYRENMYYYQRILENVGK